MLMYACGYTYMSVSKDTCMLLILLFNLESATYLACKFRVGYVFGLQNCERKYFVLFILCLLIPSLSAPDIIIHSVILSPTKDPNSAMFCSRRLAPITVSYY